MRALTDIENQILDYASTRPGLDGLPHIIPEFGWRAPAYLDRLFRLLDDPAADSARPQLVRRLARVRDARAHRRAARTFEHAS